MKNWLKDKLPKPDLSKKWLISYMLGAIAVVYGLIWQLVEPTTINIIGEDVRWENVWLALAFGYLLASVRVWNPIQPDELGVRIILGIATDNLKAGPPFAPPGLATIETTKRTTAQREFPTEPEKIYRVPEGEDDNPPEGKLPPLRVTFAEKALDDTSAKKIFGDDPENGDYSFERVPGDPASSVTFDETSSETDGLATARITAEVAHVCRLRVHDLKALIQTIPPHPATGERIDEVFRQIEDEMVATINTILTKITVAQALHNLSWINAVMFRKACRRINAEVDGKSVAWGIDLEGVFIKKILFNRNLNTALTNVSVSTLNATAAIRAAEGARQATILQGEGTAQAALDLEQKTLEGRASGLVSIKKVASSEAGRAAIGAEVAREVAKGGNTIVVGTDGATQILGVAAAAAKGLKGGDKK